MKTGLKIAASVLSAILMLILTSCDDDDHADLLGGGPGSSDASNIIAGNGFCGPQGGAQAVGQGSFDSGVTTAKIDTDGNPLMQGHDSDWQPGTSGSVNGQPVNSAQYAYVVMSKRQMLEDGVSLGDWASVTNTATGQMTWARVEDKGPDGGIGEISQLAASNVGIQYAGNGFTIGDPHVEVVAYGGTADIQGDCALQGQGVVIN
jgi:hypothetical protein